MSSLEIPLARPFRRIGAWSAISVAHPLHTLLVFPDLLYLTTLAVMLFRPPDISFYGLDRIALLLLIGVVFLRALLLQHRLWMTGRLTWPLFGLLALAFGNVVIQPYNAQTWSVFAAKWVVPFALYHLAGRVFENSMALRRLETFSLVVLVYLIFIAVLFLLDVKSFIFPRFILDESLGIHAGRARGPFLQAVANGVTLNLLGLIALDSFRRQRLRGLLAVIVLASFPIAILATMTRAVWLAFAVSILLVLLFSSCRRLRRACFCLVMGGLLGLLLMLSYQTSNDSLSSRAEESSPVLFRAALYEAGWQMFLEKPLFGWGQAEVQPELARRISDFHQEAFFFHNTYLEIAVQHGLIGLTLYLWIVVELFRLGHRRPARRQVVEDEFPNHGFCDRDFRVLWPVLVMVYLLNACFVVMNYQFVNGLLFTLAGILSAQNHRLAEAP